MRELIVPIVFVALGSSAGAQPLYVPGTPPPPTGGAYFSPLQEPARNGGQYYGNVPSTPYGAAAPRTGGLYDLMAPAPQPTYQPPAAIDYDSRSWNKRIR